MPIFLFVISVPDLEFDPFIILRLKYLKLIVLISLLFYGSVFSQNNRETENNSTCWHSFFLPSNSMINGAFMKDSNSEEQIE